MMVGNHLTETFVYSGGFREVARGTWASHYFWTKLRPEVPKKFFWETGPPPYLRVWMTPNPPPPPIPSSGSGTSLLPSFATKA